MQLQTIKPTVRFGMRGVAPSVLQRTMVGHRSRSHVPGIPHQTLSPLLPQESYIFILSSFTNYSEDGVSSPRQG